MAERYLPYTYQTPEFVTEQFPNAPKQFTLNWGEVIASAFVGAIVFNIVGKMLK